MKKHIIVVDINSEYVKFVQAHIRQKGFVITKAAAFPAGEISDEEISKQIRRTTLLTRLKGSYVIGVISRKDVAVRELRLPSTDPAELRQMASFEARKQIPFAGENTVSDFRVIEKDKDNYSRVILSIASKDVVERYIRILHNSGLKPQALLLSTEGIRHWLKILTRDKEYKDRCVCVLNIDSSSAEITVILQGSILLTRIATFGASSFGADTASREKWTARLLLEVKRSIELYNKNRKHYPAVDKILITGPSVIGKEICQIMQNELNIESLIVDMAEGFSISDDAFGEEGLPEAVSIAADLGFAAGAYASNLNLLPDEFKKLKKVRFRQRQAAAICALLFAIFILSSSLIINKFYNKTNLLRALKGSVAAVAPELNTIRSQLETVKVVESYLKEARAPLILLYELHRIVPNGILFTNISLGRTDNVVFQGTAPAMSDIFKFISILEQSDIFRNIKLIYASKRRSEVEELADFQITCRLLVHKE